MAQPAVGDRINADQVKFGYSILTNASKLKAT